MPDGNVNVTEGSPLKELALLLSGVLGIVLAIYYLLGLLIDYSVQHLSPDQEKTLAINFTPQLNSANFTKETTLVQTMLDRIQTECAHLPYQIKIIVVGEEAINAVALPGGTILVFSGLLKKLKSENELAFILGHELGHFKNKDHLKSLGRAVVLLVSSNILLGQGNPIGNLIYSSINLMETSFSREQESAADAFALEILHCRYNHVGGATDFFELLMKEEGDSKLFAHFFASHPETQTRIQELNHRAVQAGYSRQMPLPLPKQLNLS